MQHGEMKQINVHIGGRCKLFRAHSDEANDSHHDNDSTATKNSNNPESIAGFTYIYIYVYICICTVSIRIRTPATEVMCRTPLKKIAPQARYSQAC